MKFKKIIKSLSLTLTLAFSIALMPTQKAYAGTWINSSSIVPPRCTTNWESKRVSIPTLDVDCYVLYTSRESDEPSQSQMWRIPAGYPNIQDFNICGTWWLHIYVPSTGQRLTMGPYQKDDVAPPPSTFQLNTGIQVGQWNTNVNSASFTATSRGDNGAEGYDNINQCPSYWTAGFKYLEVWDTWNGVDEKLTVPESQTYFDFTVDKPGWHKLWARTFDMVGNYSEWTTIEFGLGPEGEIPPDGDPGGGGEVGTIKFDPDETDWTNEGKTGEGEGAFPVEVYYDGDNPYVAEGEATIETEEEEDDGQGGTTTVTHISHESFDVEFPLESIEVTGDAEDTVDGDRGTIYIEQEGEGLTLHGEGFWGEAEYDEPDDATDIELPDEPENPEGDSGEYNIDWTKPEIDADPRPVRAWHNDVPYDVEISIYDELSGIDGGEITVNDSSHYGRDDSIDISDDGDHDFNETISLDDGIYRIDVDTTDVATNDSSETFRTYYVDGTQPEVEFSMDNKQIFSVANGATRKQSILGSDDSFYGDLTVIDNLSGVKSISYKWTYGDDGDIYPDSDYTTIYTSSDTYYDRYSETINKEVEKPVGDNLYLHVKIYDVAGNYTYACYGPFEDPIKLRDFQVTDVRDPRWDDVFWADNFKTYKNVTYKVDKLPIDEASHPTIRNCYPKKGYAFYFDLTSEYLYREQDRIEIIPSFYYTNIFNQRIPLDLYYNKDNNPLIQYGSIQDDLKLNLDTTKYGDVWIGGLSKLTLTKGVRIVKGQEWINGWKDTIQYTNGKIQWYYGKYLIPSTSIFVRQGDSPRPENIVNANNIIVNFQIVAYKNGIETLSLDQIFTYVPNQWTLEGGPKNSSYLPGDVIVYDNKYSVLSDYTAHVIQ